MSSYGFDWARAQYFHRYALTKSMSQTAKFFGVSTSTISRGLQRFEEEQGELFVKNHTPAKLTAHGQAIWPHLDRLFTSAKEAEHALEQQRHVRPEVLLGLPEVVMKPFLLEQIHKFAVDNQIQIVPTGDASHETIALGEPHIGLFIDRPSSQASVANLSLIGGTRFDVCHAIYRASTGHPPHLLVGSYSDVEWEEITRLGHFNLPYARHNTMCSAMTESTREHIATLGMGLVALPSYGKHNDPLLTEVTDCGRFALYSLHLVMHPTYRASESHRLVREKLMQLLAQTPEDFYDGIAYQPPARQLA